MGRLIGLIGQTFTRLTVIDRAKNNRHNQVMWHCRCICGTILIVSSCNLRSGHTRSCGCLASELTSKRSSTHGCARPNQLTKEYRAWRKMKERCYNSNYHSYHRYGGRGIVVCNRWLNSFEHFLADVGHAPNKNYSIDRIDNNGNYEPNNCRWATTKQQANNRG